MDAARIAREIFARTNGGPTCLDPECASCLREVTVIEVILTEALREADQRVAALEAEIATLRRFMVTSEELPDGVTRVIVQTSEAGEFVLFADVLAILRATQESGATR